jgi:hypothetical protein
LSVLTSLVSTPAGRRTSTSTLDTETAGIESTIFREATLLKKIEISIPESSMLEGPSNYQVWLFRILKILERYKLWTYCTNLVSPSNSIYDTEIEDRAAAIQAIIESTKDSLVTTLGCFSDLYLCWEYLKNKYILKSGSRQLMLLRKFVTARKEETMTMENYLKNMKEIID